MARWPSGQYFRLPIERSRVRVPPGSNFVWIPAGPGGPVCNGNGARRAPAGPKGPLCNVRARRARPATCGPEGPGLQAATCTPRGGGLQAATCRCLRAQLLTCTTSSILKNLCASFRPGHKRREHGSHVKERQWQCYERLLKHSSQYRVGAAVRCPYSEADIPGSNPARAIFLKMKFCFLFVQKT